MDEDSDARDLNAASVISMSESEDEDSNPEYPITPRPQSFSAAPGRKQHRRKMNLQRPRPRSIRTPSNPMATTIPNNNLPSAPASPPTPAPSPSPQRRQPDWSAVDEDEEAVIRRFRLSFTEAPKDQKERMLSEILNLCTSRDLTFVHDFVCPRLKRDPFTTLPDELSLRILSFVDHPRTLARSSQVSRRWHELVNDDMAWKSLCEKHAYRKISNESDCESEPSHSPAHTNLPLLHPRPTFSAHHPSTYSSLLRTASSSAPDLLSSSDENSPSIRGSKRAAKHMSYRSHFKRRYMVETAWRTGGECESRQITPDHGVVTSLHLTDKYIVVALDNAKIHVFDATGAHQKTLHGHMMGVWAMVPWGDILVSGGCDRDVRVWNMATGQSLHTLRGHSSTVRCLRMSDANTAITGSRDTTLRIWDITKGYCKHVLVGHQASVRCVEVHGDLIASGSYDTSARIWSISEGRCLKVLHGHFSQIYAIAFDGKRVATGSLDTSVRIWDPNDGKCIAMLQGHTSLVGQLQMRGDTLVTGGSDGSVRVWSLANYSTVHRLAAHDNSVTSLQFNDSRIISGGSDGRVKVWDLKTGLLIRELGEPAESAWRVVFEEEKAIVMATRKQRTIMEVWSFSPRGEPVNELESSSSSPLRSLVEPPPNSQPHYRQLPVATSYDDVEMTDPTPVNSNIEAKEQTEVITQHSSIFPPRNVNALMLPRRSGDDDYKEGADAKK